MKDLDLQVLYRSLRFYQDSIKDLIKFSFYKPVDPVLQTGPCCGLVALAMAGKIMMSNPPSFEDIFEAARDKKFTVNGEMFSSKDMAELSSSMLECNAKVVNCLSTHPHDMVTHILNGWPMLVAYDADKNNVPCCKGGRHAHWALLCGIFLAVPKSVVGDTYSTDEIYFRDNGKYMKLILKDAVKVYVYARHGKSKYLALWEFNDLLRSNYNMFELDEKHNIAEMILPEGDFLSGLRNKAVLLSPL